MLHSSRPGLRPGFFPDAGDRFGIEVLVAPFPAAPRRVLRVTAHLYNDEADYERLVRALASLR